MVKPIILVLGAIPAIVALLIAVPLITKDDIPFSAANSSDEIEIEYTRHQITKITFGITDRLASQKTEVLTIKNDGSMKYLVIENNEPKPEITSILNKDRLNKIKAMIKETGFITIPSESFPITDDILEYQKYSVKITLNGETNQIHWPEQNATEKRIPPIISMVEVQLDQVIQSINKL